MKSASEAHVGDTFYHIGKPVEALPGFQPAQSMVFAGIFPVDTNDFRRLDESITKLTLNDASVSVHKETRCVGSLTYAFHFPVAYSHCLIVMLLGKDGVWDSLVRFTWMFFDSDWKMYAVTTT